MNERDLDLNLLLVFEAVYASRNISRAADVLGRSQPAVSNALGRLREQLDDPLFIRAGKGVAPTPRAETMIKPIREALASIRSSIAPAGKFDPATTQRHFRLIMADPMEPIVLPPLLRSIENGRISIELQPPQMLNIEEALIDDKTDLAVFLVPANTKGLKCEPLCPVDLVVMARKDHPRIRGSISSEGLSHEGHVSLSLTPGKLMNSEKVALWQRVNPRNVCLVNRISSMTGLIAATDLLGLAPRLFANYASEKHNLQVLDIPAQISDQQFFMIWHKRVDADDGHIWLRRRIREIIADAMKRDGGKA